MWSRVGLKPKLAIAPRSTQTPKRVEGRVRRRHARLGQRADDRRLLAPGAGACAPRAAPAACSTGAAGASASIDALIDKAGTELDTPKRITMMAEALQIAARRDRVPSAAPAADGLGGAQVPSTDRAALRQQAAALVHHHEVMRIGSGARAHPPAPLRFRPCREARRDRSSCSSASRTPPASCWRWRLIAFLIFRFLGDPVELMLNEQAIAGAARRAARCGSASTAASCCSSSPSSATRCAAISASRTAISRTCSTLIAERLPATLELVLVATLLSLLDRHSARRLHGDPAQRACRAGAAVPLGASACRCRASRSASC